ncbi:MAG: glycosyltransferase family 2 protein [Thermodesulfovibrionales bacterium]|nr:glycosyltransferase family 2 protein [Thermodesulfovibrionales bacterium]
MPTVISIVIPIYNEQECITELWKRIYALNNLPTQYRYEYIFVDDGSTDNSLEMLKGLANTHTEIKIISFSRNFGHDIAVVAGCDYATGDVIVLMDGDLQDPPELIPEMLRLYEQGYDVVYAKRRSRQGESFFKIKGAQLFYWFINRISSIKIPENTSNFRLMSRKVLDEMNRLKEQDPNIRTMVTWIGFRQKALEFDRKPRFAGKTKYSPIKMLKLASDGIVSITNKPLHFSTLFGAIFLLISIVCIVSAFVLKTDNQIYAIVCGVLSAMFFIGAIHLFAIGIFAEYISRIHNNTRGRPRYIISEKINI